MEILTEIPGLLDRMIEAKIMPPVAVAAPPLPPVAPSVSIPQVPAAIPPVGSAIRKGNNSTKLILIGGTLLLAYLCRHEIEYYIFGIPNKKYPQN
jgi:hypothetical protein